MEEQGSNCKLTLNSYLNSCLEYCKTLSSGDSNEQTIIFIGNQSADPDSICGCISLAYVCHMEALTNG